MATATVTPFPKSEQARRTRKAKPIPTQDTPAKMEDVLPPKPERQPRATKPKVEAQPHETPHELVIVEGGQRVDLDVRELPLDRIVHGRNPRVEATPAELKELTASIRQHGVLEPIRVRPVGDEFQIVFGHRRYEASKAAHLKKIPVVIGIADDATAFIHGLVENLQRQDLNPLDEARAFQILLDEDSKLTQEDLGKKIGRSQSYIANALRLLGLEEPVKEALLSGKLTVAHAKAMASLPPERQTALASKVVDEKLTSRDVEDRIRREKDDASRAADNIKRTAEMVEALYPLALKAQESGMVVLVHSQDSIPGLTAKGITDVQQTNYRTVTENPRYECDCKAALIVSYGDARATKCCIDPEHFKAWKSVQDEAKKAESKEAETKIEKARRAAAKAMAGANGGIGLEGQKVALYVILTRDRASGYYGGADKATGFVKRHGGLVDENGKEQGKSGEASPAQVWETVSGLSDKDLGKEFGGIVAGMLFPNVFGQDGAWVASKDAHVRQFFVDQFGIDEEVVYGKNKPQPGHEPVEDGLDDEEIIESLDEDGNVILVYAETGEPVEDGEATREMEDEEGVVHSPQDGALVN